VCNVCRDFTIECVLESENALISAMSFFTIDKDNGKDSFGLQYD
jgi:hypothetical protein